MASFIIDLLVSEKSVLLEIISLKYRSKKRPSRAANVTLQAEVPAERNTLTVARLRNVNVS